MIKNDKILFIYSKPQQFEEDILYSLKDFTFHKRNQDAKKYEMMELSTNTKKIKDNIGHKKFAIINIEDNIIH